LRINF